MGRGGGVWKKSLTPKSVFGFCDRPFPLQLQILQILRPLPPLIFPDPLPMILNGIALNHFAPMIILKYTMYPWSLQANLFIGGPVHFCHRDRSLITTIICWSTETKHRKQKNKQTLPKFKDCALHWPNSTSSHKHRSLAYSKKGCTQFRFFLSNMRTPKSMTTQGKYSL